MKTITLHFISLLFLALPVMLTSRSEKNENISLCSTDSTVLISEAATVFSIPQISREEFSLFYTDADYYPALYEPEIGCYLGISLNNSVDPDIKAFDYLTQKKHIVCSLQMTMGDDFPNNWVLSCISAQKTPNITILPPESNIFDAALLNDAAEAFGQFNIPIFVQLYPDPSGRNYNPSEYKDYLILAKEIFKEKAPNCALVWTVDAKDAWDAELYYPGDEFIDWVGIILTEPIDTSGGYDVGTLRQFDFLYHTFQKRKPIMLSQLAISHYSSVNNSYYTQEAAAEIERVYSLIVNEYPRIKLVNYAEAYTATGYSGSYSVTVNQRVLEAYKKAISHDSYISLLNTDRIGVAYAQLIKSPYKAFKEYNTFYISEKALSMELGIKNLSGAKTINGEGFFNINILERGGLYSIEMDEVRKMILLTP